MRILFDQGVFDLRNKGNVALLQVAVERIHRMWPDARLEVMTSAPHVLRLYCPVAEAVSPDGEHGTTGLAAVERAILGAVPRPVLRVLLELREAAWSRWPAFRQWLRSDKPPAGVQSPVTVVADPAAPAEDKAGGLPGGALSLVKQADLVVATGAQYMSDACRDDALCVLDRLEAASRLGIPTAMVGQGVGPFEDTDLRRRARAVYPLVDLIFVRDRLAGVPLLESLGVDRKRIHLTGDDAIELAHRERRARLGSAIGVSLRSAHYTLVAQADIDILAQVLHTASTARGADLVPIPISYSAHEEDELVLRALTTWRRSPLALGSRFQAPAAVARKVGRCRIVVTGTFHTAVFALAQGIPAVGLARTRMYLGKFQGLADQFGAGCQVVSLDGPGLRERLASAVDEAWAGAEGLRPQLLRVAEEQIALGHEAYRKLSELVDSRRLT